MAYCKPRILYLGRLPRIYVPPRMNPARGIAFTLDLPTSPQTTPTNPRAPSLSLHMCVHIVLVGSKVGSSLSDLGEGSGP